LNNGNRDALKGGGAGWSGASVRGTTGKSSGKWYWECIPVVDGGDHMVGVGNTSASLDSYVGSDTNGWGNYGNGTTYYNGSSTGSFPTYGQGDIVMVALDMDNGKVWWGVNGTWSGDPAAGTGERYSGLSGTIYPMSSLYTNADEQRILANDTEMNYSPPNGFTTLDGDKIGTTTTTT
jgi:hypothetical protein